MKNYLTFFIACCLLLLSFSCKEKTKEVVGKWEVTDFSIETEMELSPALIEGARSSEIGSVFDFTKDGEYVQRAKDGMVFSGTYVYDSKSMKLEVNMMATEQDIAGEYVQVTYDVSLISKDELRFQFEDQIGKYSYVLKKLSN